MQLSPGVVQIGLTAMAFLLGAAVAAYTTRRSLRPALEAVGASVEVVQSFHDEIEELKRLPTQWAAFKEDADAVLGSVETRRRRIAAAESKLNGKENDPPPPPPMDPHLQALHDWRRLPRERG